MRGGAGVLCPFSRAARATAARSGDRVALDIGGAGDCVHNTGKLHQHAVPGQLDDASLMRADFRTNKIVPQRIQRSEGAGLVRTHEPAVASDVGGKNGSQTALHINPVTLQKSAKERNTKMPQGWQYLRSQIRGRLAD